jgi:predicted  nucleic acid-binding Zn-ribbon protein
MAQRETLGTRVTRLENAMAEMAKAQTRMENALAHLAEVQAQDQTASREREKRVDERIEKLVSAIGELISHMPPIPPKAA